MTINLDLKAIIYKACVEQATSRINEAEQTLKSAQESANSETKSTAGDKHETGRAMMQLEIERSQQQLAEVEKLIVPLKQIDMLNSHNIIGLGSLVSTDKGLFFLAASMGKIKLNDFQFYAISMHSPLARVLIGKKSGEIAQFNAVKYVIQGIV